MSSFTQSRYLSVKALEGLEKVGDVIIPGDGEFPRFSDTGCSYHVDEVMEATNPADVKQLNMLLGVLSYLPVGFIRLLANLSLVEQYLPTALGTPFRLIGLALRGVPMTLYYSNLTSPYYEGKKVFDVLGYDVAVEPDYDHKS